MNTHQLLILPLRRTLLLAALAMGATIFCAQSQAQSVLLGYDFTGQSSPATFNATTSSTSLDSPITLSRGAGAASSTGSNSFRTVGFRNDGISTANTDYFTLALSATAGNTLSLSSISAVFAGTASYIASSGALTQFAYSLDGTNFTLIGSPVTVTAYATQYNYDLSGVTALQNVVDTTTVTLRFYASGQTTTGGFGFNSPASGTDGLDINGTIASANVPEPTTILGGALLVGISGWTQRRRLRDFAGSLRNTHSA